MKICEDCGKPMNEQVGETDRPKPGRKTGGYRKLCLRCYKKAVRWPSQ